MQWAAPPADSPKLTELFSSQAVTPMSDTKTRYFFCIGPNAGPQSDAIAEGLLQVTLAAFAEDKRRSKRSSGSLA